MKGYWLILGTEITDQAALDEYNRLWAPIAEKYQARLNPAKVLSVLQQHFARYHCRLSLIRDGQSLLHTAYQEARQFALQASKRDLLIFRGEIV